MKNYEVDFIESKIIVSKKFYQAAKTINTTEYKTLVQLRTEIPALLLNCARSRRRKARSPTAI